MNSRLILTGPTGSGKTAVGVELCELLDGEIISADSMQIYKHLDIGTAKPTPEELRRARHHLIDICEPDEPFSAARWVEAAKIAMADIQNRGKLPILCGGTGFYIKALLQPDFLSSVPPNVELRAKLEVELAQHSAAWMHEKLQTLDSAAAARLHANDSYRVLRAIEVAQIPAPPTRHSSFVIRHSSFILNHPRPELYARLNARVNAMLQAGFMDELRMLARDFPTSPALKSLGYKQMAPVLDDAKLFDEALETWKRETRRYAKRQLTWFRHQIEAEWIEVETQNAAQIAGIIAEIWRKRETKEA